MTALQFLLLDGQEALIYFIAGCVMAQVIYVSITLYAMDKIMQYEWVLKILNILLMVFLIYLTVSSIFTSFEDAYVRKSIVFIHILPPFIIGFLILTVHVTELPFWYGWSILLFTKQILKPNSVSYKLYIISVCMGSFLGLFLFASFGQFVARYFHLSAFELHLILGFIYGILALIHYLKIRSINMAERIEDKIQDEV